jgi:hypothetical protein
MAARTNGAGTPGATKSSNFAIDVSKCLMLGDEHHLTLQIEGPPKPKRQKKKK